MSVLKKLGTAESGEDRRALGREVANLFFAAERRGLSEPQKDEFGEILSNLLVAMNLDERAELSDRMADTPQAPHTLVVRMAKDEISVAAPVLQRSKVLTDEDLVEVSASTDTDHRLVLSKRENLSSVVTDELISHDELEVMSAVVTNPTAQISDSGFQTLAQKGACDKGLAICLASRAGLPEHVAEKILPALDARAKKNLKEMLAGGYEESLDKVFSKAKNTTAQNRIASKSKRLGAKSLAKDVQDGVKTLDEVAIDLAKQRRSRDLALVFSEISLLPESKTFHAITDPNGELTALMCRAFDLPFSTYLKIEEMRQFVLKLPVSDEGALKERFEAVTAQSAQKTMRFVNVIVNEGQQ